MADAVVEFKAELDDKQAQAELNRLEKRIRSLEEKLRDASEDRMPLADEAARLAAELENANRVLDEMRNAPAGRYSENQLAEQADYVKMLTSQYNQADRSLQSQDKKIEKITKDLDRARENAGGLRESLANAASGSQAFEAIGNAVQKLEKRIIGLAKRVFVFTIITKALRAVRDYFGNAIAANDEAAKAVGNLKAALMTLVQPLLNAVIPAFTAFVNVLTQVVLAVSQLVSALFGTTMEQSAKQAKGLYAEEKALKATGSAAKSAGKSLAKFDEINQLSEKSGGGGGSTEANFDFEKASGAFDLLQGKMYEIGQDILQMFRGIKDFIVGIFTGDWDKALDGILKFLDGARKLIIHVFQGLDIIVGGIVDSVIKKFDLLGTPIGNVLEGIKQMFHGLSEFIEGVFTNDVDKAIKGLVLMLEGFGKAAKGVIDLVADAFDRFLVWLDKKTNGKFSDIINTIRQIVSGVAESVKTILDGIIDFIAGMFTGDFERAWNGIKNIFIGTWNLIVTAVEAAINLVITGINAIVSMAASALNSIQVPDWVPGIGGKGINIMPPTIPLVTLGRVPALAQGGVIPPNREFLAVLGDQKRGTNIEAPLDTIVQAMQIALGNNGGGKKEIVLMLDRRELGRATVDVMNLEGQRIGVRLGGVTNG